MKLKLKIPLLSIAFGAAVFTGFAGTIAGSLAWWAYSTRASIGFQGTSVASSEQLQIGIKTSLDLSALGMTKTLVGEDNPQTQEDERSVYYFCDAGTGLQAYAIAYFLREQNQYAVDELVPVTSGSYTSGDLLLKNSLVAGIARNDQPAESKKYVKIPLAFRIMRYDSNNQLQPVKGENIWLSETVAEASVAQDDGQVYKAIRMFTSGKQAVKNGNVTTLNPVKRLINPSDNSNTMGSTAVAGILDLSGSGYYDTYEKLSGEKPGNYTIVYGETGPAKISEDDYIQQTGSDSVLQDSNFNNVQFIGSHQANEASTFYAKYQEDTYHPEELADIDPLYQNYDTINTVKPTDTNSGILTDGKPVCATDLDTGVADLDLTIWLEGWDHNVIDKENRHHFNLGLQFMISRL